MVKAHSLLYAIYVCLIVSIICGALLFFANLYNQLNLHYNSYEELYVHNQSIMNFALGNRLQIMDIPEDNSLGILGSYEIKNHGLISVLVTHSFTKKDTVSSIQFVGSFSAEKTAIYVPNFSRSLSYAGSVSVVGNNYLPSQFIERSFMLNKPSELKIDGKISNSEPKLPEINQRFKEIYENLKSEKVVLSALEKDNDSIYFNSFYNETQQVDLTNPIINDVVFKGNFILRSKDSIHVKKSAVLEDVILIAPKISIESGFKGSLQAFATQRIILNKEVDLTYPSVVCLYNSSELETSEINIKSDCKIFGAVVLFGNEISFIDKNKISIAEKSLIIGDVYCSGKLELKGKLYGTVYTNRFYYKTESSIHENIIADVEIDVNKRPNYFISIPLFEPKKSTYGVIKKVL